MRILQEIRDCFAALGKNQAFKIRSLPEEYSAWVIRKDDWIGVGIPIRSKQLVSERFSSVRLWSDNLVINNQDISLLILSSTEESLKYEFASICAQFIDPGDDGIYRAQLIRNPTEWWDRWRNLLGNSIKDKKPYSVLGEMIVLERLIETGKEPVWSALKKASHDIELDVCSYEVKSTLNRYESIVSINSQFQLQNNRDTWLVFCRFEPSNLGISVDQICESLVSKGVNRFELEEGLESLGLEAGCSARSERYVLLEMRRYKIDEHFPLITPSLFKTNQYPSNIRKITYEVDLNGLMYEDF